MRGDQSFVDVSKNRKDTKWSRKEQIGRVLWAVFSPLFSYSPRIMWGWRRGVLRMFGAKIGSNVHIYPTAIITMPWNLHLSNDSAVGDKVILYALGKIELGARSTISQNSHICAGTHDISQKHRPLVKACVKIGADTWVAADAFIGPHVTVGDYCIIGARSVVVKDLPSNVVVAGNPVRVIRYIE